MPISRSLHSNSCTRYNILPQSGIDSQPSNPSLHRLSFPGSYTIVKHVPNPDSEDRAIAQAVSRRLPTRRPEFDHKSGRVGFVVEKVTMRHVSSKWYTHIYIATGYGLDDRGFGVPSPGRVKTFLFSTLSRPALGSTQPPIQWVPGAPSPGVKRPKREAGHSSPTSAEVKKMWIYTSTPPYAFMA
jgi:hypothetical protein